MTLVRYMDKDLLKQLPQCEGGEEDLCDIDPSKLLLEHVSRYCYHHHQLNNSMFIHHSFTILFVITIIVCRHFHGNFSCIGMNAAGPSPMSDPIELVVLYPPGKTKTNIKAKTRERWRQF